jgi:putative membrane protein
MDTRNGYRFLWLGLIVVGLVALFAMPGHGVMMGGWAWGWGFGFFGAIVRTLFFVALVWLVISLFRRRRDYGDWYGYRGYEREPRERESAMEILRRRYAAGEITREQFEEMRQAIS